MSDEKQRMAEGFDEPATAVNVGRTYTPMIDLLTPEQVAALAKEVETSPDPEFRESGDEWRREHPEPRIVREHGQPRRTETAEDLRAIAEHDVSYLAVRDKAYGSSWRRRGGIGAYMMAARKADRLEETLKKYGYNIFHAATTNPMVLNDLRDLRRYLLLIEAHLRVSDPNFTLDDPNKP